ncbi:hypothetical protein B0H17DRAFT_1146649 [Mycena rosella]|uniref:Uncharacterized protein n=1 Tax=Mycena rosella TaxID=1033263 RepID=A0AAD7CNC5_MYCRO|nr:hypothetical protein B0H17DRAFT_1146649 [Mycena rosella]
MTYMTFHAQEKGSAWTGICRELSHGCWNPYAVKTHTFKGPPMGMGYDSFDCMRGRPNAVALFGAVTVFVGSITLRRINPSLGLLALEILSASHSSSCSAISGIGLHRIGRPIRELLSKIEGVETRTLSSLLGHQSQIFFIGVLLSAHKMSLYVVHFEKVHLCFYMLYHSNGTLLGKNIWGIWPTQPLHSHLACLGMFPGNLG